MKQVVSFDKLKLTNHQLDDNGHVSTTEIGADFIYRQNDIKRVVALMKLILNKNSRLKL